MTQPLTWILDGRFHERMRGCGGPSLAQAAREHGHRVVTATLDHDELMVDAPLPARDARVVVHACIGLAQRIHAQAGPHWWCQTVAPDDRFTVQAQHAWIGDLLVNTHTTPLRWDEARRLDPRHAPFFIRPDSAWKHFGGTVARADSPAWSDLLAKDLPDDLLVIVAPLRTLLGEARHLIVDGRVVGQSTYRWNNRLDIRIDTHPLQRALADLVAARPHQPDRTYMCDTALVPNDDGTPCARVMEINPFTSAGLYGINTRAIVDAFSHF